MELRLENILPDYFDESRKSASEIWGKTVHIKNGDRINVAAPSGSGKTSLVQFLYKMRSSYKGTIFYDHKELKAFSAEELAQLRKDRLSIVLQDMRLFPEQTLLQNLEIKRQLNPFHKRERLLEMAEMLGISHRLDALAKNCSYGEQQRTVIIRALLQPFELLLMDEPFSHLDENNSRKAMDLILEEVAKRNAAVLFAELNPVEYFPATQLYHL